MAHRRLESEMAAIARWQEWLRYSIAFVWLATALASVLELNGQSAGLLSAAGITDPTTVHALVLGGAALDAVLGVAMCVSRARWVYGLALAAMLGMTVVATFLLPSLWLHPLGPLTKNLPIAVALWLLATAKP